MPANREAYVDTSALIAFADRSDSFHDLFRRAFSDPPPLITTSLVIADGHGWFAKRFDSYRGLDFHQPDRSDAASDDHGGWSRGS
jgi:predicted nucleic acid-binding protein